MSLKCFPALKVSFFLSHLPLFRFFISPDPRSESIRLQCIECLLSFSRSLAIVLEMLEITVEQLYQQLTNHLIIVFTGLYLGYDLGLVFSRSTCFIQSLISSLVKHLDQQLIGNVINQILDCFSFSMVILLDLFSTRFPMDILPDLTFVTNNIAVYVERISPNNVTGKMCYVTVDSKSRLNDINCLPCRNNSSCGRQMVSSLYTWYKRTLI